MSAFFVITPAEIVWLCIILVLVMAILFVNAVTMIKQLVCKHGKGARETSACDAICNECGKNLGFIGNWRAAQQKRSQP